MTRAAWIADVLHDLAYAQTILYGVKSTDGASMAAAALVMVAVAACGSLLPVLRATRIDPSTVLRE